MSTITAMLYPSLLAVSLLTGCAEDATKATPRTRIANIETKGPEAVATVDGSAIKLSTDSWSMLNQINDYYTETVNNAFLSKEFALINTALCERLQTMRTECLVRKPLLKDGTVQSLSCDGTYKDEKFETKFSIELDAPATATFQLKANDIYLSNIFNGGTAAIDFTAAADDKKAAPSLGSLYKLSLQGKTFAATATTIVAATLKLNGQPLLVQKLKNSNPNGAEFNFDLSPLFAIGQGSACRMSDEDYEAIRLKAKEQLPNQEAFTLPYDKASLKKAPSDQELASKLTDIKVPLGEATKSLEGERNRNLKLFAELTQATGQGCRMRQPIRNLSIEFQGQARMTIPNGLFEGPRNSTTEGKSTIMQVNLGNIRFDIDNSKTGAFGTPYLIPKDYSTTDIIGGITQLSIQKLGAKFTSLPQSCTKFDGVVGGVEKIIAGRTCYQITEDEVVHITGIKISANGKLIFSDDTLNVELKYGKRFWAYEKSIQSNPDWLKEVIQATDCAVTE